MNSTRGTDSSFNTLYPGTLAEIDLAQVRAKFTALIRRQTPTIETVVLVVWAITPLLVAALVAVW